MNNSPSPCCEKCSCDCIDGSMLAMQHPHCKSLRCPCHSKEEGEFEKAKRIGHYPDGRGIGWEQEYDAPKANDTNWGDDLLPKLDVWVNYFTGGVYRVYKMPEFLKSFIHDLLKKEREAAFEAGRRAEEGAAKEAVRKISEAARKHN